MNSCGMLLPLVASMYVLGLVQVLSSFVSMFFHSDASALHTRPGMF